MNNKLSRNQALLTAIGFMIGSGIFFRADNILASTHESIWIATMAWLAIGSTLIFAGLSVAAIASETDTEGGFIGYIEVFFTKYFGERVGRPLAFIIGWYQIVVYAPILTAIVAIVFAGYFTQLFGMKVGVVPTHLIALVILVFMFLWNAASTKIAALISSTATIVKLIPLIVLAIAGMAFGNHTSFVQPAVFANGDASMGVLALFYAPMLSMAFAFDGWVSVGSLSRDIDNPKKNLPFVFTWSVIITVIVYTTYFVGVSLLMPPSEIIAQGNDHVGSVASALFGPIGEKFVLTAVTVSVLGTCNSLFMAGTRYTQKLAKADQLKFSNFLKVDSKNATPKNASVMMFSVTIIYLLLFMAQAIYITANPNVTNFFSKVVIDDIPLALNSMFYLLVFFITYKLYKEGKVSKFIGIVAPVIAAFGQILIIISFFSVNGVYAWGYLLISFAIIGLGFLNLRAKK